MQQTPARKETTPDAESDTPHSASDLETAERRKSPGHAGLREKVGAPVKHRGHDLGFWLVVMNARFEVNAGAVLRVASNFGASGVLLIGLDSFHRSASLGVSSSMPVVHVPTPEAAVDWCRAQNLPLVVAELTPRSTPIHQTQWPERVGLVIGDERDGVPVALLDAAEVVVEVPMYGFAGSMNMAVTAGILAFEHVRRLGFPELQRLAKGGQRSGWSSRVDGRLPTASTEHDGAIRQETVLEVQPKKPMQGLTQSSGEGALAGGTGGTEEG